MGLYKDVRNIFFFIVITATRRLKRHTPRKTNRRKNSRETVLLSFRGNQGRHKADLPWLPLQERLQNTDLLPLESQRSISINGETAELFHRTDSVTYKSTCRQKPSQKTRFLLLCFDCTHTTTKYRLTTTQKLSTAYPQVIHIVIHTKKTVNTRKIKGYRDNSTFPHYLLLLLIKETYMDN